MGFRMKRGMGRRGWLGLVLLVVVVLAGCTLTPQFTYQGRLTDPSGNPVPDGTYSFTFVLKRKVDGAPVYTETRTLSVKDGLFQATIGPATLSAGGITADTLAQPLELEITVGNGVYTETLSPAQRLLGAPYAFSLLPGAVISGSLDTTAQTNYGVDGVLEVHNLQTSNPVPALYVRGDEGLQVDGRTSSSGTIWGDRRHTHNDLALRSNDDVYIYLDQDGGSSGYLYVNGVSGNCSVSPYGNLTCSGTKSAVVDINGEPRALYAIESPEVWFEDFGTARLQNGVAVVPLDPLFAATVNLSEYHVFLTPLGETNGLYVAAKDGASFTVRELGGGRGNVAFDYRIVAKRKGYETKRLELMSTADEGEEK